MDVLEKITKMRLDRKWSMYQLAERSELPQSTISSWYKKKLVPSISSLEHICDAFEITLSQFFLEDGMYITNLTQDQTKILKLWGKLTRDQQKTLSTFLELL